MRPNAPEFLYSVVLEVDGEAVLIDWGNKAGWISEIRDRNLSRFCLVPKSRENTLPVLCVNITGEKRWILFSRVFASNRAGFDRQFRIYAAGWQELVDGRNVKNITWIYPDGTIEMSEEPSMVYKYLK